MNNIVSGKNLLFAGVGGQGILFVAELAARAAIHAGFDVKKTEVHGAAQRGGSVVSHVRYSTRVHSPPTPAGEVDILLALEKLEGLRWAHYVRAGGLVVLNNEKRPPMALESKRVDYPEQIEEFLRSKGFLVRTIDATVIAAGLGNYRAANVVLLGAIAHFTDIDDGHWQAVIKHSLPPEALDLNLKAFEKGKEIGARFEIQVRQ